MIITMLSYLFPIPLLLYDYFCSFTLPIQQYAGLLYSINYTNFNIKPVKVIYNVLLEDIISIGKSGPAQQVFEWGGGGGGGLKDKQVKMSELGGSKKF